MKFSKTCSLLHKAMHRECRARSYVYFETIFRKTRQLQSLPCMLIYRFLIKANHSGTTVFDK